MPPLGSLAYNVILLVVGLALGASAELSLLGLGGGGMGMVKGSSFGIDTSFSTAGSTAGVSNNRGGTPKLSRVHGPGLIVDLDVLEIKACGGTIKYSPTQIEFQKGSMRWVQMMSEGKLSLNHNDKTVLQIGAPDASPYYTLGFTGSAAFRDLLLDQALGVQAITDMCIASTEIDKLASIAASSSSGVPSSSTAAAAASVLSASASAKSAVECGREGKAQHLSVQQVVDKLSRELLRLSQSSATALAALRRQTDSAMKPDMFVELRNNVITAQRLLMNNFTASEAAFRAAMAKAAAEMTDATANLTADTRVAVAELQASTSELVQTQCVGYVNTTVAEIYSRTNRSLSDLRLFVNASVAGVADEVRTLAVDVVPQLRNESTIALRLLRESIDAQISTKLLDAENSLIGNISVIASAMDLFQLNISTAMVESVVSLTEMVAAVNSSAFDKLQDATALYLEKMDDLNATMANHKLAIAQEIRNESQMLSATIDANFLAHNQTLRAIALDVERVDAKYDERVAEVTAVLESALNSSVLELRYRINETSSVLSESLAASVAAIDASIDTLNASSIDFWNNQSIALTYARDEMTRNVSALEGSLYHRIAELYQNISSTISALNATQSASAANMAYSFSLANAALNITTFETLDNMTATFSDRWRSAETERLLLHSAINATNIALHDTEMRVLEEVSRNSTKLHSNISNIAAALNATHSDLLAAVEAKAASLGRNISDSAAVLQSNVSLISDTLANVTEDLKSNIDVLRNNTSMELVQLNVTTEHAINALNASISTHIFGLNESWHATMSKSRDDTNLRFENAENAMKALVINSTLQAEKKLNYSAAAIEMLLLNTTSYLNSTLHFLNISALNSSVNLHNRIDTLVNATNFSMSALNSSISVLANRSRENLEMLSNHTLVLFKDFNSSTLERFLKVDANISQAVANATKMIEAVNISSANVSADTLKRVNLFNETLSFRLSEAEARLNASDSLILQNLDVLNASLVRNLSAANDSLSTWLNAVESSHRNLTADVNKHWADQVALSGKVNALTTAALNNYSATQNLIMHAFAAVHNETLLRKAADISLQTNVSASLTDLRSLVLSNDSALKESVAMLESEAAANISSVHRSVATVEAALTESIKNSGQICNSNINQVEQRTNASIEMIRVAEVGPIAVRVGVAESSLEDVQFKFSSLNASVIDTIHVAIPHTIQQMDLDLSHKLEMHIANVNANFSFLKRESELAVKIARAEVTNEYSNHIATEIREVHSFISSKIIDVHQLTNSNISAVAMRVDFLASDLNRGFSELSATKIAVANVEAQTADLAAAQRLQSSEMAKLGEMQLSSMTLIDSSIDSSKLMFESISARLDDSIRTCGSFQNQTVAIFGSSLESAKEALSLRIDAAQEQTDKHIERSERRVDKLEADLSSKSAVFHSKLEDVASSTNEEIRDLKSQVASYRLSFDALNAVVEKHERINSDLLRRLTESDDIIRRLSVQLQASDALIARQQAQMDVLSQRADAQSRESATSAAVESLRSDFAQLQSTMLAHAGKVLDLVTANLAEKSKR